MRLTKLINNNYVSEKKLFQIDENYMSGSVIDQLAKLENMIDDLKNKNDILSNELEKLRLDGMSKTYNFREKMGMKLTNSRMLTMLEEYKII